MGPVLIEFSKGGGFNFAYKSGSLEDGQWRLGVALSGERGPSFRIPMEEDFLTKGTLGYIAGVPETTGVDRDCKIYGSTFR